MPEIYGDIMSSKQTVTFLEVLRGLRSLLREPRVVVRGVVNLIRTRAHKPLSIGRLVERQARERPDAVAAMDVQRRVSYAQFNAEANRYAAVLRGLGIGRGDSVGILLENRIDVLIAVTGVVKLGAVASMLNHNQRGDVLAHSLATTSPRALIIGNECLSAFYSLGDDVPDELRNKLLWVAEEPGQSCPESLLDATVELAAADSDNPPEGEQVIAGDAAFYIFTSGTTGLPKAAVLSHNRWLRAMAGVGQISLRMRDDDIFYCALPLYHNNALTLSWGAALGAGAALAVGRRFSASRFWDEVRHFDATAFCYIGEMCRYLLAQPPAPQDQQHRVHVCLGNGLRPELWHEFQQRFDIERINEFYGASECNLLFTNALDVPESCGTCPLSHAIVQYDLESGRPLRNAAGKLTEVDKGEVGLLLAEVTERSPYDGYTNDNESEKKLVRDAFKKGDCWFNTGDLVRHMGYHHIQFVDRLGDTFRWKGENVATTEVEAAVNKLPQVEESVVYGVAVPHADGRAGMAAVTLGKDASLDTATASQTLQQALPSYAVPLFLRVRHEQETTATFKHRKTDLVNDGFNPGCVSDELYVLLDRQRGYEPLTEAIYADIQAGNVRL